MTKYILLFALLIFMNGLMVFVHAQKAIKHYIFFSREREGIQNKEFYLNPGIEGAQIAYLWRRLEPQKNHYDFNEIEEDLKFLSIKGKKLFIQIQDVTFDSTVNAVPKYILEDTVYHGGQVAQYGITRNGVAIKEGWVARRWDDSVAERFHKLLKELAKTFDGKIEGINLPETSIDLPDRADLLPKGFSRAGYVEAIKRNMEFLRKSFTKSVTILYANFMPYDSKGDLKEIYVYAKAIRIGMGGPDIKVYKTAQMENSYPLIRNISDFVITGVAVQEGNPDIINPKTGKTVTLTDILDFAVNYLKLDYIFWGTEEPFYSKQVLPYLNSLRK
jgi:hypothetical protein